MDEQAVDGAHGFAIHSACWDILTKASEPGDVSLERLVSVCESLPLPSTTGVVRWGHDYDGVLALRTNYEYPWTEVFAARHTQEDDTDPRFDHSINDKQYTGVNVDSSFQGEVHRPEPAIQLRESTDCFSRLPWEVCEMFAMNLLTQDALNLRLASRTFFALFDSSAFWLSRFEVDGERGRLFEVLRARDRYPSDELR